MGAPKRVRSDPTDDLATQHYAVSDYWPHVPKMERITLEGVPVR